jgi:predicted DNA-binding WGR domain protein
MWGTQVSNWQESEHISIEALAQFTDYIRFVSCDPAKNRNRFYHLSWQRILDGSAALVCTWGRIGTRGRSRVVCYTERTNARDAIARIIRRRLQRGYHVTNWR